MTKPGGKPVVLGFLTVRGDEKSLRGGYLLTTEFGRPIEFHYTSELVVSRQQQVLHGAGFQPYVYSEVLGKPLTDRQTTAPRIIAVDLRALLELRRLIPAPVVWIHSDSQTTAKAASNNYHLAEYHPEFAPDAVAFEKVKTLTPVNFDWLEPFERLHLALAEIRDPASAVAA